MVTIALTPGCPAGIGPELFPKALVEARLKNDTRLIWCASAGQLEKHAQSSGIVHMRQGNKVILSSHGREIPVECLVADSDDKALKVKAGVVNHDALLAQIEALDVAIALAKAQKIQAVVTGPIRKSALANIVGRSFDGQTEYLHHFLPKDSAAPLMCFAGSDFLLGLATIHVPLKDVPGRITEQLLEAKIRRLNEAATAFFDLKEETPRLVVFGLNPHAGEGGLIGDEELKFIAPTIDRLVKEGFNIEGPAAADGFFGHLAIASEAQQPHAVLAMYHDQGLGPYKLLCKGVAVNMTIGLTIARISPAHGTADALAGTYRANTASMTKAIRLAERIVSKSLIQQGSGF